MEFDPVGAPHSACMLVHFERALVERPTSGLSKLNVADQHQRK